MELKTLALIATVLLAATTLDTTKTSAFVDYQAKFGKSYTEVESAYRQAIFNANVDAMNAHNADSTQTYKMGINRFTDMTQEEFETTMLTPRATPDHTIDERPSVSVGYVNWVT